MVRVGNPSHGLDSHNLGGLHKYSLTGGQATRPNIVSFRKVALSAQDIGIVYQSPNQGSISTDLGSQARYRLKFPVAFIRDLLVQSHTSQENIPIHTRYLSLSTQRWDLSPRGAGFRGRGSKHNPTVPGSVTAHSLFIQALDTLIARTSHASIWALQLSARE